MELGRTNGLDAPHHGCAARGREACDDAGDQTASSHRNDDRLHIGQLLHDLKCDRGLSGNDIRVVEGGDDREALVRGDLLGLYAAVF